MEVVWVALITAVAAVVPQTLTWWQNQKRDGWERARHAEEVEREARTAEERRQAERDQMEREALVKFVDAVSKFVAECGIASIYDYGPASKHTHDAIGLFAPMMTASGESLVILHAVGSVRAFAVEDMLEDVSKWGTPTHAVLPQIEDAARKALVDVLR